MGQALDFDTNRNALMTKILVVEDESDIRDLLVDILCDSGYDVVKAGDGGAALDLVSRERPDIILLDVMMPVMDGLQVLKVLKGDPITRDTTVIMVSAKNQEREVGEAKNAGAWDYLIKPWEAGEVEAKVASAENLLSAYPNPPPLWFDKLTTNGMNPFALSLSKGGRPVRPMFSHRL